MKRKAANLLIVLILAISITMVAYTITRANAAAAIWTDKGDYAPEEVVTIYGTGFLGNSKIVIEVTRPDMTVNVSETISDEYGSFTATYDLDGVTGTYAVTATDESGNTATTTFTDKLTDTTATISFSANPVAAGTTVTITGTVVETSSGDPVTSGSIKIDEYELSGVGVPYPTAGASWVTIASGTPNAEGNFSTDFDTTGLGGTTIGFRVHYPASPPYAETKSTESNLVINVEFVGFKVSGYKNDTDGNLLNDWDIVLTKPDATTETATTGSGSWADGYYEFTITSIGDYSISETLEPGWTRISPASDYTFTATSGHADITDQNFTNFENVDITVYKYEDKTGDGLTGDDTPISGWSVKLYKGGVLQDTQQTGANGGYTWSNLGPGSYAVGEDCPSGWTGTSDLYHSFGDVESGGSYSYTITNFEYFDISGTKYEYPDVAAEGWEIQLWQDGTYVVSATTDDTGHYEFLDVGPGVWQIKEVLPSGWTEITPKLIYGTGAAELGYEFTAYSGQDVTGQDFTNFEWLTVSGHKYENGKGGLSGWTIKLYNQTSGLVYDTTTTGAGGTYSFTVKDPGTYTLNETLKAGWTALDPTYRVGEDSSDVEIDGYSFTVSSGVPVSDMDFTNFKWVKISGYKYEDTDGSKPTTHPLENWQISLWKGPIWLGPFSVHIGDAYTDVNGYYEFNVTFPGYYGIGEVIKPGWTMTGPHTTVGSDTVTILELGYGPFEVTSGEDWTGLNFWNFKWLKVSGYKQDTEGNGLEDWNIKLFNATSGLLIDSNDTLSDGYYEILVTNPGDYWVNETLLAGWTKISPAPTVIGDSSIDKVVAGYSFTAASGTDEPNRDFTNFKWVTISGTKYKQALCDGFEDGDASDWTPVNGIWTVTTEGSNHVYEQSLPYYIPGVRTAGQTSWTDYVIQAKVKVTGTTWGRWGGILFRIQDPGTAGTAGTYYELYLQENGNLQLVRVEAGVRTGIVNPFVGLFYNAWWNIKAEVVGNNIKGKAWEVGTPEPTSWIIDWTDPTPIANGKIGLITFSNVADQPVYFDDICVRVPLQDWHIQLYDGSGQYGPDAVTDSHGAYAFTVEDPGTYAIKEVLPSGWTEIYPEHHYGDGSAFLGYDDIAVSSGVDVTDMDFVNFEWLTVSGYKEEYGTLAGLSGWEIRLYRGIDLYDSETTPTGGYYEMVVKDPGTYTIKEVLKAGWTAVFPTYQVGDPLNTMEVEGYTFTAKSGFNQNWRDFVNFKWLKVSGVKFFDGNGDHIKDAGEPGLNNWEITLTKPVGHEYYTTATVNSIQGYYEFIIKEPGEYTLSETLLALWWEQTTPDAPGTYTFTVQSGVDIPDKDFGNWLGSESFVTTSGLCYFDYDSAEGQQFKLIFTPDVPTYPNLYRLTASNPGQFYYNIFYTGSSYASFTINIPYPFVTQGAMPIHVYSSLNTGPCGCLIPGTDITSQFTILQPTISWDDMKTKMFGETILIEISGPSSGFLYINIHLDYGLKQNIGGLSKLANGDATNAITISNSTSYDFSVDGDVSDIQTVGSFNVFKRDPGFVGMVTDSEGNPLAGVKVQIYGPTGKLLATVYTDKDGWYFYNYKYTGKAATFTVKLPAYNKSTSVTIKSNSMTLTDFVLP